jgi:hypothetical protein
MPKKSTGRPPGRPFEEKPLLIRLNLRLTEEDYDDLRTLAQRQNQPVAAFARTVLLDVVKVKMKPIHEAEERRKIAESRYQQASRSQVVPVLPPKRPPGAA